MSLKVKGREEIFQVFYLHVGGTQGAPAEGCGIHTTGKTQRNDIQNIIPYPVRYFIIMYLIQKARIQMLRARILKLPVEAPGATEFSYLLTQHNCYRNLT